MTETDQQTNYADWAEEEIKRLLAEVDRLQRREIELRTLCTKAAKTACVKCGGPKALVTGSQHTYLAEYKQLRIEINLLKAERSRLAKHINHNLECAEKEKAVAEAEIEQLKQRISDAEDVLLEIRDYYEEDGPDQMPMHVVTICNSILKPDGKEQS
jgi:anion-transporting  ArsA/GET3 family ATPase